MTELHHLLPIEIKIISTSLFVNHNIIIIPIFPLIINLDLYVRRTNPNLSILIDQWTLKVTLTLDHKPLTLTPYHTLKRR